MGKVGDTTEANNAAWTFNWENSKKILTRMFVHLSPCMSRGKI